MTENGTSLTGFMDKAFWTRPEGKIAKLLLGAAGVGVAVGAFFMLPAILALLQTIVTSLLTLAVTGGILFAIIALVMNDDFRNTIGSMFRSGVRWFTGIWIDLAPIAILKDFVEELKKSLRKIDEQLKNLARQVSDLKRLILSNEKEKNQSMELMSQAKKKGLERALVLQGRKAQRLERSNLTLQQLLSKMEMVSRVLQKMRENCDFSIQDTESEVEITIREYTALQAGQGATREALKIIKGDSAKKAMFDQAMETLAVRTAGAVGEMEDFMRVSQGFFDSVDLQNGVFDENALEQLEAWERQADNSVILGPGQKQSLLNSAYSETVPFDSNAQSASAATLPASATIEDYFKN